MPTLRATGAAHRGLGRLVAALAVLGAGALALAPASAASAHDYLVSSDPAAGATVSTPIHSVTLTFNDVVLDLSGDGTSSIVQVTGPDGRHFETGCAKAVGRVVTTPVALGGPGSYEVAYQIVSADGHTVSERLDFSYRPPAGTPTATGAASRPACGPGETPAATSGGAATTAGRTAAPRAAHGEAGNLGMVIGLAVGIVALAVIAIVIVLITARRRPTGAPAWHPDEE